MRTVIVVVVALALGAYFGNSYLEKKAKREADEAENRRIEETTKSAVASMVGRTGAIDDWAATLSKDDDFRLEPILTVELEKLWLQNRPILFVGSIDDIATYDQSLYMIVVKRNWLHNIEFETNLQLSLLAPKHRIDAFLIEHPDIFADYGLNNGIAVVAKVNAIRTEYRPAHESYREVKIGDGELLEIVFSRDVSF